MKMRRYFLTVLVAFLFRFGTVVPSVFALEEKISQEKPTSSSASANEMGMIPVLEYHRIGEKEDRWTRSYENFKNDLLWLYNNDYRAVSIEDYVEQKIAIPAGKKPVIFTFDDGTDVQIQLDEKGNVLSNTFIALMDEFLKTHPDFGSASVFYVTKNLFPASPDKAKTVQYLVKTGREVQNHTLSHADLSKLSPSEAETQLNWFLPFMKNLGIEPKEYSIAYPFGGIPKNDAFPVLQKYAKIGFLVGADPARMPYDVKFDAFHIPRIQAIDDEWKRWFRRVSTATAKQTGKDAAEVFTPFVSDGDPNTLMIPDEKNLKKDAVRKDLTVKISEVKIPEVFPYEACNDPDSVSFLQHKMYGPFGRLSGLSLADYPDHFFSVLHSWIRHEILLPEPHGIYFTASTAGGETGKNLVERLRKVGGNMVVFDVKETPGLLSYLSEKEGKPRKPQIPDLPAFIQYLKSKGIYVVARIVVFKDNLMSGLNPSWAIQHANGGMWRDDRGTAWLDPSNPYAQDYIISLAREVAEAGVDEVQYDYVRFPTEGDLKSARYRNVGNVLWPTIRDFLKRSREALMPYGVALSADVFGIVGWNKGYDAKSTGQKIECIAPYLDTIYPMGYPSHFGPGFAGYDNPADKPYDFVYKTTKFFVDFARGTHTNIRPWLQAFTYRVTIPYNSEYIRQQIKAGKDAGGNGFALWNAGNNYDVAWGAF